MKYRIWGWMGGQSDMELIGDFDGVRLASAIADTQEKYFYVVVGKAI